MKKVFFILISMVGGIYAMAQEPADALRYGWTNSSGTARQQAIGGAIGSLGGDISATMVNPAGLGLYKTGDAVFSPGCNFTNNKSTYYGRTESGKDNSFILGTSGIVLGSASNRGRKKSSAFSIVVNRAADFNNKILYRGKNNQSSYSQKFLDEIDDDRDGNSVDGNYPFGASLAFRTYWIDTVAGGTNGNFQFKTRAPIATGLLQENNIITNGGITELAIGYGVNQNDKFYWGLSVSIPFLKYDRDATFTEADATDNTDNNFDYASFHQNLNTRGMGLNIKAGLLYKPTEQIRLGLALHSPTFYSLTDLYSADIITNTENYKGELYAYSSDITDLDNGEFRYSLTTPFKAIGSASYVFREIEDVRKQKGFITADVEYVNYASSAFRTNAEFDDTQDTKNYLKELNNAIDKAYKSAFNFRIGGELKFNTVMGRLGVAYYGNPYRNLGHEEKGSLLQLSGGLGFRHKGMFLDIAYVHSMSKDVDFAYRLQNNPYTAASIKSTTGQALITIGVKI